MKLYLIKEDGSYKELTIGKDTQVVLNYYYDSLENPTSYISENSYSFQLPRDANNNQIFDEYLRLDSITETNTYSPYRKHKFILLNEDSSCLSSGLLIVESINRDYYKCKLQGSLGLIFNILKNSGFSSKKASEDDSYWKLTDWFSKYWAGGTTPIDHTYTLNSNLVKESFNFNPYDTTKNPFAWTTLKNTCRNKAMESLQGMYEANEMWRNNIIGFAPSSQSFYDEFDSKSWYRKDNYFTGETVINKLPLFDEKSKYQDSENHKQVDVGDGLVERQMCEYRSYMQQPYIYVYRLFQMYQEICENATGYKMTLDNRWFNSSDTIFQKTVYMLPKLYKSEDDKIEKINTDFPNRDLSVSWPSNAHGSYQIWGGTSTTLQNTMLTRDLMNGVREFNFNMEVSYEVPGYDHFPGMESLSGDGFFAPQGTMYPYGNIPVLITYQIRDYQTILLNKRIVVVPMADLKVLGSDEYYFNSDYYSQIETAIKELIGIDAEFCYVRINNIDGKTTNKMTIYSRSECLRVLNHMGAENWNPALDVSIGFVGCNAYIHPSESIPSGQTMPIFYQGPSTTPGNIFGLYNYDLNSTSSGLDNSAVKLCGHITQALQSDYPSGRSGGILGLETLMENVDPFDILLKYTKLMNLVWVVDDENKEIKVMRRRDFFTDSVSNYGIKNWENNVDWSSINLTPISWDYKNALFNYDDVDEDYMKGYLEKYDQQYGSMKIKTQNQLNNETKELFDKDEIKIAPSCLNSQILLPYSNYTVEMGKRSLYETEPMISNQNDNKTANISGNFYVRSTNSLWDRAMNDTVGYDSSGTYVNITDDVMVETNSLNYAWHGLGTLTVGDYNQKSYTRPRFNICDENDVKSVIFAPAREIYIQWPYLDTLSYVYDREWKNYIEEVYNTQNKTLDLEAYMSEYQYIKIKKTPIIQLRNIIYLITKIQYNQGTQKAKMTLRQISNLDALRT